ncbi:hypothetical protein Agub_g6505, partial [Astrephomene gubernaculifera]
QWQARASLFEGRYGFRTEHKVSKNGLSRRRQSGLQLHRAKMPALPETVYQLFFKRTTAYVPMLLVGAYFSNEAIDYAIDKFWSTRNKGKLFADVIAERA